MPKTGRTLRVLVVDDDRDGADTLGMVVEELGNQVHVTYGGTSALDVATLFRPDLMLIDLAMPDMDGCRLVMRFRQIPAFAQTQIVAITGHADQGHKTLALKAGFDKVLFKPVPLTEIRAVLASVVPVVALAGQSPQLANKRASPRVERRLPINEARKLRKDRESRILTQAESEAAICEGIIRFQEDYLGWRAEQIRVHLIKDFLLVRLLGVLTVAERQLAKSLSPEKGRDLIKLTREQLLELARPMLESMVHEVIGVKVLSMHHDISTVTGEEVILFSLTEAPRFSTTTEREIRGQNEDGASLVTRKKPDHD
ncbi:MAG: Na-translocating system protein MpsC family protein [Candidatus Sulfotelmatobacter sp.]